MNQVIKGAFREHIRQNDRTPHPCNQSSLLPANLFRVAFDGRHYWLHIQKLFATFASIFRALGVCRADIPFSRESQTCCLHHLRLSNYRALGHGTGMVAIGFGACAVGRVFPATGDIHQYQLACAYKAESNGEGRVPR